jgi:epoxyqueuosine reductase
MPDAAITARIAEKARAIGFDLCGVAAAESCDDPERLPDWLARGYAGEMHYLHDGRRHSVSDVMPAARSVIVCAMNYNTALPYSTSAPAQQDAGPSGNGCQMPRAWISRYAWGSDYHDAVKPRLDALVSWLRDELRQDFQSRIYVDTGPVLERLAAKHAGLGWLAKNTCLINQRLGSWLFLGVILTDLDLAPTFSDGDALPHNRCGACTRCIDACPTDAFVAPYVLDARRCIAYLTIELRGAIPEEFRPAMGSMVFGCDICQDVCPWNRKSPTSPLAEFLPRKVAISTPHQLSPEPSSGAAAPNSAAQDSSLFMPALDWLISLTEDEFRRVFRGSPVKRAKWRGLLRNACVALGNSNIDPENPAHSHIFQRLEQLAACEDAILAEHAAWTLDRLRARASQIPCDNEIRSVAHDAVPAISSQRRKFIDHAEET